MARMWIKSTSPTPSPCDSLCSHPKWAVMDAGQTAANLTWVRVPIPTCHTIHLHTSVTNNCTLSVLGSPKYKSLDYISIYAWPEDSKICQNDKLHGLCATDPSKTTLFPLWLCIKGVHFKHVTHFYLFRLLFKRYMEAAELAWVSWRRYNFFRAELKLYCLPVALRYTMTRMTSTYWWCFTYSSSIRDGFSQDLNHTSKFLPVMILSQFVLLAVISLVSFLTNICY